MTTNGKRRSERFDRKLSETFNICSRFSLIEWTFIHKTLHATIKELNIQYLSSSFRFSRYTTQVEVESMLIPIIRNDTMKLKSVEVKSKLRTSHDDGSVVCMLNEMKILYSIVLSALLFLVHNSAIFRNEKLRDKRIGLDFSLSLSHSLIDRQQWIVSKEWNWRNNNLQSEMKKKISFYLPVLLRGFLNLEKERMKVLFKYSFYFDKLLLISKPFNKEMMKKRWKKRTEGKIHKKTSSRFYVWSCIWNYFFSFRNQSLRIQ